jgi:lipoate-protein ligase A
MANYIYVSPTGDGWKNLAVDEWFLDNLSPEDMLLYFYVNQNAVIIGKNQNPWRECNLAAMEADNVQLVRRVSGGGAVFHDGGNLNFSFITGAEIYDVHRQLDTICQALRTFGIPCAFTGRNDLVADGRKFSGNAFCARGPLRQHHGTLLIKADLTRLQRYLQVDPRKMQAKGVTSVRSRVCNLTEFDENLTPERVREAVCAAFEAQYGPATVLTDVPGADSYYEKQKSWDWRLGKTPAFDLELDPRFDWGGVQLLLTLKEGAVDSLEVYSDAMDPDLAQKIKTALTGCRFDSRSLHDAVAEISPDLADWLLQQGL